MKRIIELIKRILKKHNYVFYLGSTDMLPPPLSKEDEAMYVERSMVGDEDARNVLIEHNLRLVVFLAKKYENTKIDLEDLVSIGTIGLIKAVNTYRSDKNIKLATYASRCIDNEILMVIRNNKKSANDVSLDEPIGKDKEGNEITFIDIIVADDEDVVEKISNKQYIMKIYDIIDDVLTPREKDIIVNRYGLYKKTVKTQQEIADELEISRSYISRIEKKAVNKLKKALKI